jgi:cytochrome c oxidase subunit 1
MSITASVTAVVSLFFVTTATYYWLSKWTGYMYNESIGKLHFWVSLIGVNLLFFPQHFLGLAGMLRRIPDYPTQFVDFNMLSSVGAFIFGFSQLLFVVAIWSSVKGKQKATSQVWDGAVGLEWTLPSPAPYHSFSEPPKVN